MTQDENCKICRKPMKPFPMGEKDGFAFFACQSCGSVMVLPWIGQGMIDAFFGEVQPEATHVPQPEQVIARYRSRLRKICGPETSGKRFLDVGCRQGYVTKAAQELGMTAKGIDPHDFFVRFAQGKYGESGFSHATVSDYASAGQQADVIAAIECFCEQPDPDAYAAALKKILAPNGLLYIEEPDGNSFHLPRKFTSWGFAEPPLNFVYTSKKGLAALLARHGLKIRKSFFSWNPMMKLVVVHA